MLNKFILAIAFATVPSVRAQSFPSPLDPARNVSPSTDQHKPLPEEYIWTAKDVTALRPDHNKFPWNRPELRTAPHYFRAHFSLATVPADATVYVAGPREAHVYLNGHLLGDFYSNIDAPINFRVFHVSAAKALLAGDNVLAIEAVRGRGIVAATDSAATQQIAYGEVLAVKVVPAGFGVDATALLKSDPHWRSTTDKPTAEWTSASFNDSAWPQVSSLGPIESNVDFFQWNADAGMYGWPGYMGMSPDLRTLPVTAVAVKNLFSGNAKLEHTASLTTFEPAEPFSVTYLPGPQSTDADAPSLLLDFGREISGRLLVESASEQDAILSVAYGESELEAMATGLTPGQRGGNYLGTNVLEVPANGIARGPKSAFRFVQIRFLHGAPIMAFKSIRAEAIYYPVQYAGSFESSDPLLNRIWETGAYTAHLCMQDGIWDAPKRDRGRWVGDLDIEGRVMSTAFGDRALIEQTLHALVPPHPSAHVNGIPGYSALWITSLYNIYAHTGDKDFVAREHNALLQILAAMDSGLNASGVFDNPKHQWLFVDWAPGLYGYTREAVIGTNLEYVIAYNRASLLFKMLGDTSNAGKYSTQSQHLLAATRTQFRDPNAPTYGTTWQLNAVAMLASETDPHAASTLWTQVFSHVKQDAPTDPVVSPYFNAYVLDAMAAGGHIPEALTWMRAYWGGMLAEGATSFWESYDLRWPKSDPHLALQADGTAGYFVSMAHGWSSGPTAWLIENVLGIREPQDGYRSVVIAPNLGGLDWARGTVPTPHGPITLSADKQKGIALDLPAGIEHAFVKLPIDASGKQLYLGTRPVTRGAAFAEYLIDINKAGHYELIYR